MDDLMRIALYSSLAGVTVFLGGLLANVFDRHVREGLLKEEILHTSIAFGGGIIVAAVAFVLVPRGMAVLPMFPMAATFLAGAIFFYSLDSYIAKKGGSASQLLAMLLDFVPESIALGAIFAADPELGLLLAVFIGLQNFPESFNSFGDLRASGYSSRKCLVILFLLSFSGIVSATSGYYLLSDLPHLTAALMLFSSGGILYLIFQDIAPMSKMQNSRLPTLGVSLGFLVGMVGHKLLG